MSRELPAIMNTFSYIYYVLFCVGLGTGEVAYCFYGGVMLYGSASCYMHLIALSHK
jgi:hypothetical protein